MAKRLRAGATILTLALSPPALAVDACFGPPVPAWATLATQISATPTPFAIPEVKDQEPSSLVTSAEVTPAGYNTPSTITVSGPTGPLVEVNGSGQWVPSAAIVPGQKFRVRLTSSSVTAGTTTATVTIGTQNAVWNVVTRSLDNVRPDDFSIKAVAAAAGQTIITSEEVTPAGYIDPAPISVTGGGAPAIEVGGNGIWTQTGTITPGQKFRAHLTTGPQNGATTTANVNIGGRIASWKVTTLDTVPDSFTFASVANQGPSTLVTSDAVTITGIDTPTPVTVSGPGNPAVEINGSGSWVTGGTVSNGQALRVRVTAPAALGEAQTVMVSVGGVSAGFGINTIAKTSSPAPFSVPAVVGAAGDTVITSASVKPTGLGGVAMVSLTGDGTPEIQINDTGAWSSTTTMNPGDTIRLRVRTGAPDGSSRATLVTIGSTTATWLVTTSDTVPNAFPVASVTSSPNAVAMSAPVMLTGIDAATTVSVTGPGTPQIELNGNGVWTSSITVTPGSTFRVRLTAPSTFNSTITAALKAGGVDGSFAVTTRDQDQVPDTFTIPTVTAANGLTLITSAAVSPTGFADPAPIAVAGETSAQISVAGGAWATSATITPGQSFSVRLTTGIADGASKTAIVTLGGVSAPWAVITQDKVPDAFSIPNLSNVAKATQVSSAAITPTGYDTPATISVTGDPTAMISVNGGSWKTTDTIAPGQSFVVRLTTADAASTIQGATISISGVTASWQTTTVVNNAQVAQFSFGTPSPSTVLSYGTTVEAWTTTISGNTTPSPVDVVATGGATLLGINIGNSGWVTPASGQTVQSGQQIGIRIKTDAVAQSQNGATVTVGGGVASVAGITPRSASFSVQNPSGVLVQIPAGTSYNLDVRTLADAAGYTPGRQVTVQIPSNAVIGSTSTSSAALTVANLPGSTVVIVNNGLIQGRGGNGANGPSCGSANGSPGGPALSVSVAVALTNNGKIWGGGGGGGSGVYNDPSTSGSSDYGSGGGGGGAGTSPGTAGSGSDGASGPGGQPGSAGTETSGGPGGNGALNNPGGAGGGPGQAGANGGGSYGADDGCSKGLSAGTGGAPGKSVIGASLVTWTSNGDVRGPTSP